MRIYNEKSIIELNAEKQVLLDKELKIQSLEDENATLIFNSAMADMKVDGLEDEVAGLIFKVANLEMGGNL